MDLEIEFKAGLTLRRQLEDALRVAVRSGRLPPGSVLPTSRDLADQLGVSRGVVVDSYAQLATEGYLSARRGSGTRVASLPAAALPPARPRVSPPQYFRYELRPGIADYHSFPRARWQAALLGALRELPDIRLTYADHRGVPELRNAVAGYLVRMRGAVAQPEYVVICCAASHALTVLWQVLRGRGARRVAIEDPGWRWQRYTVEQAGLEAVPVRVDDGGMVVSELAAADVDAVVMTPAHHYPTGVVMTAERRADRSTTWRRSCGTPGSPRRHWTRSPWPRSSRTPRWSATCGRCAGATAPSGRSWSARWAGTSRRCGSAAPRRAAPAGPAAGRRRRTAHRDARAASRGRPARTAPALHGACARSPGAAARFRLPERVGPGDRDPAAGRRTPLTRRGYRPCRSAL